MIFNTVDLLCNQKLNEYNEERVRMYFEMYRPNATVGDVFPNISNSVEIAHQYALYMNMNLSDIEKMSENELQDLLKAIAKPLSKIWIAGNVNMAVDVLITESIHNSLKTVWY